MEMGMCLELVCSAGRIPFLNASLYLNCAHEEHRNLSVRLGATHINTREAAHVSSSSSNLAHHSTRRESNGESR